jgi:hypothetical protein
MRPPTCARPVSDRHAQPDWIGAGAIHNEFQTKTKNENDFCDENHF